MKKYLLIFLLIATPCYGATYHVDPDGGEDYTTVAQVNAASFNAGDEILFQKGHTWNEVLTIPSSGSEGNVITFSSYGTGAAPILYGISATLKNYVTISNLECNHNASYNMLTIAGCNNVTVSGCTFDGNDVESTTTYKPCVITGSGTTWSYSITVSTCTFKDNAGHPTEFFGGGLDVDWGTYNVTVTGCTFSNNKEVNLQTYLNEDKDIAYAPYNITFRSNSITQTTGTRHGDGINMGFDVHDCIAERNYVYINNSEGHGYGIAAEAGTDDCIIRNNIILGAIEQILILAGSESEGHTVTDVIIANNTLVGTTTPMNTTTGIRFYGGVTYENSGHIVVNNIFKTTYHYYEPIRADGGAVITTCDNNVYYNGYNDIELTYDHNSDGTSTKYNCPGYLLTAWISATGFDASTLRVTPSIGADYTLNDGAPCIDAGVNLAQVTDDYIGTARDANTDIGAYEYVSDVPVTEYLKLYGCTMYGGTYY